MGPSRLVLVNSRNHLPRSTKLLTITTKDGIPRPRFTALLRPSASSNLIWLRFPSVTRKPKTATNRNPMMEQTETTATSPTPLGYLDSPTRFRTTSGSGTLTTVASTSLAASSTTIRRETRTTTSRRGQRPLCRQLERRLRVA